MKYKELIFPKAMNLNILSEILTDRQMLDLIKKYKDDNRKSRRIILPSEKFMRKCIIYFLMRKHKEDFKEVKKELKEAGLKQEDLRKDKILELYESRKKELVRDALLEKDEKSD